MKIVVVTGASSGMGKEFVKQVSEIYRDLDEIWVIARRMERLKELQQLTDKKIHALAYDLTEEKDIHKFEELLVTVCPDVRMLINSSGFGKIGKFTELPYDDNIGMVQLNCEALVKITYLCLPFMKKGSRVIQLASSASFLPQPKFAVYAATKSFVLSFSRALNMELKEKGVHVMAVCPGPVKTEFFDIAETTGKMAAYKKLTMADPQKVVTLALMDSAVKKDISVYGASMKAFSIMTKILPHRFILEIMRLIG